jgi:hypothetical protein
VLSSPDAFTLLIGRLEAEGWRIERQAPLPLATTAGDVEPPASPRER